MHLNRPNDGIPVSVHKNSLENSIHHIFNFILIFLKLQKKKRNRKIITWILNKNFYILVNQALLK